MYVLFRGGHSFKVLKNNTEFYEIKNGPYKKKNKDIEYFKQWFYKLSFFNLINGVTI